MIKKIQKYLLLHHPLVWNTRLFPMLFVILGLHIITYLIGYQGGYSVFDNHSRYSNSFEMYTNIILVCGLVLIIWLIYYNYNNAVKLLYPRSSGLLYKEWCFVLLICVGIALSGLTMTCGIQYKWRDGLTLAEAEKKIDFLQRMEIFVFSNEDDYFAHKGDPLPLPQELLLKQDIKTNAELRHFGASLLFYHNDRYRRYQRFVIYPDRSDSEYLQVKRNVENIYWTKSLLGNNQRDSLLVLMTDLVDLLSKHKIDMHFTAEQWLDNVYNPPLYEITEDIWHSKHYYKKSITGKGNHRFAYDYKQLLNNYENVRDSYMYDKNNYYREQLSVEFLIYLHIALLVSMLIFTFRITGIRSWLIALVIAFILCISYGFLVAGLNMVAESFVMLWILTIVILFASLFAYIKVFGVQGRAKILLNLAIWSIYPVFMLIVLGLREGASYTQRIWVDKHAIYLFLLNILIIILLMYPISMLVRRFKGLPDE